MNYEAGAAALVLLAAVSAIKLLWPARKTTRTGDDYVQSPEGQAALRSMREAREAEIRDRIAAARAQWEREDVP